MGVDSARRTLEAGREPQSGGARCASTSRSTAGWVAAASRRRTCPTSSPRSTHGPAVDARRDLVAPRRTGCRPRSLARPDRALRGRPRRTSPRPAAGHPAPPRGRHRGPVRRDAPAYDLVRIGLAFYGTLGVDIDADAGDGGPRRRAAAGDDRGGPPGPSRDDRRRHARSATAASGPTTRLSRIATLPDRLRRRLDAPLLARCASALVRGRRVPLVGRVSMDSVCVDVTDVVGRDRRRHVRPPRAPRVTSGSRVDELARLRGNGPERGLLRPRSAAGAPRRGA